MANKVAFITGGNKGLGLETAKGLAEKGVTVLIGSRDVAKGQAAAKAVKPSGGAKVEVLKFDINNLADHSAIAKHIEQHHGGVLDILVNNAGVSLDEATFGPDGANTSLTVSQKILRDTFDTNFFHLIAFTQTLVPYVKAAPEGRIVNLSSILGSLTLHADPKSDIYGMKVLAYNSSKTALNAFTVHLAHALKGTKVKVNAAHPGWVKTDMGGANAPMELEDGGKTSVELALLPASGPTGGFYHMGKSLPW